MRRLIVLAVVLVIVGCSANTPNQVAPAITAVALTLLAFDSSICDEIPIDDIRTAGEKFLVTVDTVEEMCSISP